MQTEPHYARIDVEEDRHAIYIVPDGVANIAAKARTRSIVHRACPLGFMVTVAAT